VNEHPKRVFQTKALVWEGRCVGVQERTLNNLEIALGLTWLGLLGVAHAGRARFGRWLFRTTVFGGLLLALGTHLLARSDWLGEGVFFALTLGLLVDLLFIESRRWSSWFLVGLSSSALMLLIAWALQSQLPEGAVLRMALTVLSFGVAGTIGLVAHQRLQQSGFVRIALFVIVAPFADLLIFSVAGIPEAIHLPSRLLILLFGVVLAAWYLDHSNLSNTMSTAQREAYDSLLGTVEALARPDDSRLTQEKLISTLVTTTQVVVAGSSDGWGRLLSSAVMLVPGAEGGSIRVRFGDEFRFVAQQGFDDDLIGLAVHAKSSLDWHGDGLAWHRGEPRVLSRPFDQRTKLDDDPRFAAATTHRIRANLYLPVLVDDMVVADINLDSFSAANAFTTESVQTARQFALQAAALLKAQREREKLESRLREFEFLELVTSALHHAHTGARIAEAVVSETVRLMSSPHAALLLTSHDGTNLRVSSALGCFAPVVSKNIPWGHGLSWAAIHARETILSDDALNDPRASDLTPNVPHAQLTVPLLDSSGAPLGALLVARDLPQRFTPLDQRLVEVIGRVAAGALERVQVTRDLQRQVQESRNLLSLAQLLEGNDAQSLEAALERVRQLGVADAALLLVRQGQRLRARLHAGYFSESLANILVEGIGYQEAVQMRAQRTSFETTDEGNDDASSLLRRLGARTAFTVMTNTTDAAPSTLVLYRYTRSSWSTAERHTLEAAARMLGALMGRLERLQTLETAYSSALKTVGSALEMRDLETANHTERVAHLAEAMARELELSEPEIRAIRWGAYLHDIGKFGLSDAILRKPSALTTEETLEMRRHPMLGYELVKDLQFLPETSRQIVRSHHERWDGTGYPDGLHAEEIPIAARIFAVCDVFDALRSKRVYKEAYSVPRSLEELRNEARNGRLDSRLVRVLEGIVGRMPEIKLEPDKSQQLP
jgi:putative nucleotidyltransferase with HDIG domain